MALVIKDRVKQTTTTTGTGTLTLNGTVSGFQTFAAALSDGDTTYYSIFEPSTNNWEVGLGTWTEGSSLLARTTILASSNSGSAINLTAQAEVFISQPAGKAAFFNADGDLELNRDPQTALQAATKEYVDTIAAAGLHYHDPVRVEKEGNLSATYDNGTAGVGATLTNNSTQAALVIDGVTLSLNDRVLIYEQTDATQNGVYTVTDTGSASTNWVLTRSTDTDSYAPSDPNSFGKGDAFFVLEGNAGAGELYVMNTEGTITFGTTNITFTQVASTAVYSAGNGLTLTGTVFAADAGTGVTVDGSGINIGQAVETTSDVTFNSVSAALTGNVTGNVTGDVTGNADTATALETARNIGGVSFDGTASINLPGVNTTGNQDTTGNAATATAWETGRTISLTGDVTGSVTGVDGSGNASIATTIAANSVALGTDTTGNYVGSVASGNYITGGAAGSEGAALTIGVDATPNNTASKVVARDASGNFSAGTITADLSGNASTATSAAALTTARTVSLTGAVTGSTSFDGSGNVSIATTATSDPTLTLSGDVTGSATFTNLGNATLTATVADDSHTHDGRYYTETEADSRFLRTDQSNLQIIPHIGLFTNDGGGNLGIRFNADVGSATQTSIEDGSAWEFQFNNDSTSGDFVIYRDVSISSAGETITWEEAFRLEGSDTEAYLYGNQMFHDGYHPNADAWTTARTLSLTGDVTGSVSWDGSADASISTTLTESPNFSTSLTVDGHTLQDSTNRSGLLEVSTSLGTWRGFSIASTGTSHWSIMGDQDDFGLYDDVNNEWILLYNENSTLQLYANGSNNFSVTTSGASVTGDLTVTGTVDGVDIAGSIDQALLTTSSPTFSALTITNQLEMSNTLDMNNFDIYGVDQIFHHGDTNTYIQFHASDQFRVVTGGIERFEVNNSRTQADRLLVSGGLYEDYDALSGTTPSVDVDAGGGFSLTMTGNTTFTFAGAALGGSSAGFVIELTGNGGTVTWPTSVKWAGGTAPDAPASGETDLYVFYTRDGGSNWYGVQSIDAAA